MEPKNISYKTPKKWIVPTRLKRNDLCHCKKCVFISACETKHETDYSLDEQTCENFVFNNALLFGRLGNK